MDKIEARLEFLERVGDKYDGTLNAASANTRVEMLIKDAERVAGSLTATPPKDIYGGWRPFPVDIVSYYSVAYVTCLEWHARSRLTDFFAYEPQAITEEDLKKAVPTKVLTKLIASNASIPQFIAANLNFSDVDAYLNTFGRIFKYLSRRSRNQKGCRSKHLPASARAPTSAVWAFWMSADPHPPNYSRHCGCKEQEPQWVQAIKG